MKKNCASVKEAKYLMKEGTAPHRGGGVYLVSLMRWETPYKGEVTEEVRRVTKHICLFLARGTQRGALSGIHTCG